MRKATVYWIRNKNHTNIREEGYVGVTLDLDRRLQRHKLAAVSGNHCNLNLANALISEEYEVERIFEGSEDDCYLKELELRPEWKIGWNIVPGGGRSSGRAFGMMMPLEFRMKASERMRGNKLAAGNNKPKTAEHRKKISEANSGKSKSDEQKRKQSEAMRGRKQSPEHIEKKRLAALGKKRGPYKKKPKEQAISDI